MRALKKFFKTIITIILLPTIILVAVILWSYATGTHIKLPAFGSEDVEMLTSGNFLLDAEVQTEEVFISGDEESAGIRGYINISNADIAAMTHAQYYEFYQNVLKDSSYKWFSVICPDGTGLFIPDCADGAACFCRMDELGRQTEVHGYLIIQDDSCVYQEAE